MSTLRTQHWLYSDTPPACTAALKTHPEDFVVTEDLGYSFSGDGEHQFLWVEKKLANTAWVAEQLAKFTGLPLRNVTYAGRKDKYAVTRQWFGLHAPGKPDFDFSGLELEGVKILRQERHNKKLRIGQLKGNHFTITLRDVSDVTALTEALQQAARNGVPNYFGEQRFGSVRVAETGERQEGGNLQLAEKMIAGEAIRNRNKRNMALSALRSWLFNEVLSERIRLGKLNDVISGDALMLSGSHSFFIENGEDSGLQARYEDKDLSPTAPLWGKGDVPVTGEAAKLELAVAGKYPDVTGYLSEAGMKQERRPVKIWPAQLEWQHNGDTVIVSFSLPSGCYATTVLRDCVDTNGETAGS